MYVIFLPGKLCSGSYLGVEARSKHLKTFENTHYISFSF